MASRVVVVASNNEHKIREIKEILNGFEIKKASDVISDFEVEETGNSFCGKCLFKSESFE